MFTTGLSLIFPVGGEMKKVAGGQGGGGRHRWKFQDKVTTKIVPNITNFFHAILNKTTLMYM